jgi:beta-glucanase (GH16 family)
MSGGCYYFFDEFSGSTLDLDKWFAVNRIGDLANSELQCMEADNVSVSGGNLLIVSERLGSPHSCGDSETAPQNMNYASGQVMQRPVPFIYGSGQTAVIDVRYKAPPLGTGLWPLGLWLLGYEWQQNQPDTANIPRQNWPVGGWCEIDVMEQLDNTRSLVNCVVHFGVSGGRHEFSLPFNSDTRFMVYRLEWSLNSLVWKVDAEDGNGFQTLRTVTGAGNVPDVPMYVVLSTAVGGVGGGTPNDATLPQTATWDYVRVTAVAGQTIGDGPAIDAAIRRRVHRNTLLRL